MKKIFQVSYLSILICLMMFILSSCGFDKNNATISDISYDNNKDEYEVYVKENGKYVPFLVLQSDYQDGKTLLLRKECLLEVRRFNDYSSYYEDSEIDQFLSNEYITYLDEISDKVESIDITIAAKEALGKSENICNQINRKVFLLSLEELCLSGEYDVIEGEEIKYFENYHNRLCLLDGKPITWMLRTPDNYTISLNYVYTGENRFTAQNAFDSAGVRPAFCIDSSTKILYEKYSGGERFVVK